LKCCQLKKAKLANPTSAVQEIRERIPRKDLLDKLFTLFAEQDAITLKDLTLKTNQPQVYVREVVSEIATQTSSGFQLKREFKLEAQRSEAQRSAQN